MENENIKEEDWEKEIEEAKQEASKIEVEKEEEPTLSSIAESSAKGFDEPELIITPKEEEKKPVVSAGKIADLSEQIYVTSGDVLTLMDELNKIEITEESAEKMFEEAHNKLLELTAAVAMATPRAKFQYKELKNKSANLVPPEHITDPNSLTGTETLADKLTKGAKFKGIKNITGQAAVLNTMARLNPFRKVYLVHSGFHIVIRDLEAMEIKNILDSVDAEYRDIGRNLGGYYFLLDDIFFIQKTAEILKATVIDSNLPNWSEDNRLLQAISFLDHDTILGAYCSSMYKNGVKYKFLCPELSCSYSETVLTEFNKLKRIDYTRLPKEALEILFSTEDFTKERFLKYQELIGAKRVIPVDELKELHLKVPSIFTFIKFGTVIISTILRYINSDTKHSKESQIRDMRNIFYYKNFISWVEKLVHLNEEPDENGSYLDFETAEPEAIDKILESSVWEDNPNRETLINFFSDVRLVHFAYLGGTCPLCKKTPDPNTNGLIPIDVADFFFNLCQYRRKSVKE